MVGALDMLAVEREIQWLGRAMSAVSLVVINLRDLQSIHWLSLLDDAG